MRILWLNWRDIRNPAAGGAEVFTHEVAKRLVKKGYEIVQFASHFLGAMDEEQIDGLYIVRDGGKYSVYRKAENYFKKYGSSYDLVVDEINTRPFLTSKYVKSKPVIALIHQLAREGLFYELSFPLNYIAFHYLEKKWLSSYKEKENVTVVTVSNSTKEDLESFVGFRNIFVVPEGLSIKPLREVPIKESVPTVVFVGRLKKYKLPDHALRAFEIIKKSIPDAKMWVIGDGYLRDQLENTYGKHQSGVTFFGRIKDNVKYRLMSRAHVALVPSVKEGWGLVVTEANAVGTPAIAYNVSGLRDSVIDGKTGILLKENTPIAMAESAISLLNNGGLLNELSVNALVSSASFNWDKTADIFSSIIKEIMSKQGHKISDAEAA